MFYVNRILPHLFLLFFFNLSFCPELYSQDSKVVYPHGVFWSKLEVNQIFDNKIGIGADFVLRRKNAFNEGSIFDLALRESFRPWIHYQFSPYARLSFSPLGYMHTNEYIGKESDLNREDYYELRTTLQFFHHVKQLKGRLMHTWRYRYEWRWQETQNSDEFRYLNRFRFRYRIRYLINTTDFYENGVWYAAVSNEIGLNIGKSVVLNTFNQNRLYVGIGYRFLNACRAEIRYVDRFRTRGATGFEFDHGKGLMIGFYIDQFSKVSSSKDIPTVRFYD
ncbi:MAG: DUF2490 domain-containing protein [Saprospiraceae bacterium]|nr:DUF2490 domain-containing protein [Saprospiraceae bacterium]